MSKAIKSIRPLGFPWETQDPFLFCAYHEDFYPKGNSELGPDASLDGRDMGSDFTVKDGYRMYHGMTVPGFPSHPHRGFETVTVVEKGLVDHADSLGAAGRFGNGDVQWMTAGKGIQHSEMFPLLNTEEGNPFELFQIWLNLPKASKMVEPHFKMFWSEDIPIESYVDEGGKTTKVKIVAGEMKGVKGIGTPPDSWAADPNHKVGIFTIQMEEGARWIMPASDEGVNRTIYFHRGIQLLVDDERVSLNHYVEINAGEEVCLEAGAADVSLLVLEGKPLNEPVAQYGPFVMNSNEEIQQAFTDYQATQFGGWPWEKSDHVHPKEQGRFAKHADGMVEDKA